MQEMMSSLRDQFEFLIIDTPPVLMVTDAVVLAPRVDGVIIVVKPSVTKRAELHHVIERMQQVNARLLGVVLNDVNIGRGRYYYYRQYSSYKYKYYKGYYSREASPKVTSPNPSSLMAGKRVIATSSGKEKNLTPPGSDDLS
jgi:Mrp family chromosome partitioning ATPase